MMIYEIIIGIFFEGMNCGFQQKVESSRKVERHFYRYALKKTVFQSTDKPSTAMQDRAL